MFHKSSTRLCLSLSFFVGVFLSVVLLLGLQTSQANKPETLTSVCTIETIELVPDQLTLTGDAATVTKTVGYCTQPWLSDVPTGTIILGVDPTFCDPASWNGGSATTEVFLEDVYSPTVLVLELSWPDGEGRGLHSPDRNQRGTITFDGRPLWGKRTTRLSASADLYYTGASHYYATEHESILTTIVVTQSAMHTLTISVSARTAWDLSQITLSAYPYPTTTQGIGYSPFRDCQYSGGDLQPSIQDVEEDLFRLFHTSSAVRTYSSGGINGQIPALANEIGLPVFAGAWIDADLNYEENEDELEDDAQVQALIDLACTTDLEGVIVGNEYYLRHRSSEHVDYLLQRIQQVRNGITACGRDVPITTAEIDNLMFDWDNLNDFEPAVNATYRKILDEIDFVMVHIYPFWNGMPIDGAAAFTVNRYKAMQALVEQEYPGRDKWLIIGEAGWPSDGAPNLSAVPSPRNQRQYMLEFLPLARQEGVEFMYFDAFDELWKIEEPGRVGQHWGYSHTDRTAKYHFYGVLLPVEQLPSPPPPLSHAVYLPLVSNSGSSDGTKFYIYSEWPAGPGHFVPSGWMGNIGGISMFECDRCDPHSGEMAVRFSFSPNGGVPWAGVYWQYPENNWGEDPGGGIDLSWADRLTFWARSDTPNARVTFLIGGIGYPVDYQGNADCSNPSAPYPDSVCPKIKQTATLSSVWTKYTIHLPQSRDLSSVIGGFGWVTESPITFYLDDIVYESVTK